MDNNQTPLLHIYSQGSWHEEAYIVGDRKALELLYKAIEAALQSQDGTDKVEVSVADGEGYTVHIISHPTHRMENLTLPYSRDCFKDKRHPSSLVKDRPDDEIMDDEEYFEVMRKIDAT